jgi:hypothetical protein
VPKDQLATFLLSALLASESLLLAAFGNLYSVYTTLMMRGGAGISRTLRILCVLLALTIALISIAAVTVINVLSGALSQVVPHIEYALYLITILIALSPVVVSWRILKDAGS